MKLQNPLFRILSLSIFVLFIAVFVSYKSRSVQHGYNEQQLLATNTISGDSDIVILKDTLQRKATDTIRARSTFMSSSKSAILFDKTPVMPYKELEKGILYVKEQKKLPKIGGDSLLPPVWQVRASLLNSIVKTSPPKPVKDSTSKN